MVLWLNYLSKRNKVRQYIGHWKVCTAKLLTFSTKLQQFQKYCKEMSLVVFPLKVLAFKAVIAYGFNNR